MIPDSPPMMKNTMNPTIHKSGVWKRGVPVTSVVSQANSWIALGITMIRLAAANQTSAIVDSPTANMWCTHTPKPMNATRISASATSGNATIRRPVKAGMIDVAIPNAGRMMM